MITNKWTINRFSGTNFESLQPNLPKAVLDSGNGRWQIIEDHLGEWWVASPAGLFRFPRGVRLADLKFARPTVYTTKEGLADNNISRLFEDSRGDIWISSFNPPVMMTRWNRATNTFQQFTEADGFPGLNWANVFAEDSIGQVWIGMHNGGLIRYRDGNFSFFKTTEKNTPGITQGLLVDRSNRLWMATRGDGSGIITDGPRTGDLRVDPFPVVNELSSRNINTVIDGQDGHMYFGTVRGIDPVEIVTGNVRHFTTDDGLPNSEITASHRDKDGRLWFGTRKGIARLNAEKDAVSPPLITLIGGFKVSNVAYPLSDLGQTAISYVELGSDQNQIEFNFFALNFAGGENLKYRHKLEEIDSDWSAPTDQNTFTVNLTSGKYRFLVSAVTNDGAVMSPPATAEFRILPPIWKRWWFVSMMVILIGAIIYAAYRFRLKQLLAIDQVRTRIATDLHDDIGSSLSQIAILSEVVRQKVGESGVAEPLDTIAETSREIIDAMGDIVWAINPDIDHLSDLVQRIRRFAADIFEARGIEQNLQIPEFAHDHYLGTDIRREIY